MAKKKIQLISEGYKNHFGKPKTRRALLGQGMIAGAASVWAPSILSIASKKAYGIDMSQCDVGSESMAGTLRVLNIDLGGGAGLAGKDVMVGQKGGQSDPLANGYGSLGQPGLATVESQNIAGGSDGLLWAANSPMLAGIRETCAAPNRTSVNGFVICGTSGDDNGNNIHDPSHIYAALGQFALVPNVGTVRANPVDENPSNAAIRMNGAGDSTQLAKLGTLGDLLSVDGARKVLNTAANLSERQLAKFNQKTLPESFKTLVECGYAVAPSQIGKYTEDNLNPELDPIISSIFNMGNGDEEKAATVALLVLRGMAGVGTVSLGGYDYHNRGIDNQNQKNQAAGRIIGGFIEAACQLGVTAQINIWSDGSVGYNAQGAPTGDRGSKGCGISLIVTPGKTPLMARTQIGAFNADGGVDTSIGPWSQTPAEQARAMAYNGFVALFGDKPVGGDANPALTAFTKISKLPLIVTALEESTAVGGKLV